MKTEKVADTIEQPNEMAQAFLAIAEALKTIKSTDAGATDKLASIEKFLMEQERTKPHENIFNPPMVSAYNPLGERDFPRPLLKCKMIWVGFKLSEDCCTREEIELLNRVEGGVFRVTKADGKKISLTITPKVAENGKLELLSIHFPCKTSEDRHDHMSMASYLREVLGESPSLESLQAQVASLKAELASRLELPKPSLRS